jgi:alpha/beta superfamily hydrolase
MFQASEKRSTESTMSDELPPPPSHPALSPPVRVLGEEDVSVPGLPSEPSLEAHVRGDRAAERAVLLCHPHPLYGGTMHSAVIVALAKVLAEKEETRVAVMRFNYRGVGASEGSYGEGKGETLDTRAALRALRAYAPSAKVAVCGYSFGTWVGLRAAAAEGAVDRVALIAPAVRIFDFLREDAETLGRPIAIYLGDRDQFCDVGEAETLASELGASLQVFPGNDHYFLSSRRKLAEAVVPFLVS